MNTRLWRLLTTHCKWNRAFMLVLLFVLLGSGTLILALGLTNVTATWSNVVGSSGPPSCLVTRTVGSEQQVLFGDDEPSLDCDTTPTDPDLQSGFGFEGSGSIAFFDNGVPFVLGELTHYNRQIFASSLFEAVDLNLTVNLSDPAFSAPLTTTLTLDETANNMTVCPYGDTQPCADRVSLSSQSILFNAGGTDYQLEILGLIPGQMGSCTYDESQIRLSYISDEDTANSACLFGRLTPVDPVAVVITKQANVTELEPGELIDYRIDYNCFSTTTYCSGVVLTDYLPDELIYVGSTGSTHTIQPTGSYSSGNNSVRFQFIDPLPAGSTGFVTIRARLRDDGTIADGQEIQNLAVSTLTNGTTTTTTHSIPAVVASNWAVTKSGPSFVYLDTDAPVTDNLYTVAICSNNSGVNLLGAQMVDTLPTGAEFVSASGGGVYNAGPPQTVTWSLGDLDAAGGCVERQLVLRFPSPPFSDGQNVTNPVTGSGTIPDDIPWTDTADVTDPLETLVPNPTVSMSKSPGRSGYVVGAQAQFLLAPRNTGNVPLDNFTITDTLPPQFDLTRITVGSFSFYDGLITVRYERSDALGTWLDWPGGPFPDDNQTLAVSALGLPGGVYINRVQWDFLAPVLPGFAPVDDGGRIRLYGTILATDHDGNPVTAGTVINNSATLDWHYTPGTGGPGTGGSLTPPASATIDVDAFPIPALDKTSAGGISAAYRFLIGQQVGYYVISPNNNTGITLNDFTITDTIPVQFNVTAITVGGYENFGAGTVTVRYQANGGPWTNWFSGPPSNQTLDVSSLGLPGGSYITAVQWIFGTVVADFRPTTGQAPRIYGQVMNPDRNGAPVNEFDTMSNTALLTWSFESTPSQIDDTQTDTVMTPVADPSVNKSTRTSGPYIPGSRVTYALRVGAASNSPSALIDPIVMELLPPDLQYETGSWAYDPGSTGVPAPSFELLDNYDGTGRTLLRWRFSGSFAQGRFATITFNALISPGATEGSLPNEYYVTSNVVNINGPIIDVNDLDGDTFRDDQLIGTSTSIPVSQLVGLDSSKGVRGQLDSEYSVYPDSGRTVPNGSVAYRLEIINRGNVPINNVKVVDILPFVGDTGVQDLSSRDSEWRPVLTAPVAAPSNVTVYYSTSGNPCRPEIIPSGPLGCTAPNWSLLPPTDISTVYSLRFDFNDTLAPGASFVFEWTMQAPPDPLGALDGTIAWNSFAYTSQNATTGIPLRPAEPNKVGIEMESGEVTPLIQLEKATNTEDADLPTGPLIQVGDPVTWTYVITNTGNTRLANIVLTDDILGVIYDGATSLCAEGPIPTLEIAPDPASTFTCTVSGTAISGQYENLGTVTGEAIDIAGTPDVSDTDPSHYLGYDPLLARLGDYVWIDSDGDGQQDAGETGLGGITVNLLDAVGNPVLDGLGNPITALTDGSGFYIFTNLPAGTYSVEFVIPPTYIFTGQNVGDDTTDSDADPTTGRTQTVTLAAGDENLTLDAGVQPRASLGDFVWRDINDDGLQDTVEPGVAGVEVALLDSLGAVVATTFTDADGYYRFLDLLPGDYSVRFTLPAGFFFSRANVPAGADVTDSDADELTGETITINLAPGENDPTWDAGLVPVASLGDRVWRDNNNNGRLDFGEPGVDGVTVNLLDSSGNPVLDAGGTPITTTTDSSGLYRFENLRPGDYMIEVVRPTGYMFSPQDQGNDGSDSDVDPVPASPTYGRTIVTTLLPGENDLTWDAGLVPLASLGDYVWEDVDGNGQQDTGESPVDGVEVYLLDGLGNPAVDIFGAPIPSATTDGSGLYSFTDLPPGDYQVEFVLPGGYIFTRADQGANDSDSDANRATGRTIVTTLSPGENDPTWDAGLVRPSALGDRVWYDDSHDGLQDGGEPNAPGVTVRLLDSSGNPVLDVNGTPITAVTDGSGEYLFDDLLPGTYIIEFVEPTNYALARRNQGGDDAVDSDPDRFTGRTAPITLPSNTTDRTWDAGLVEAASIGNWVWIDENLYNNVQDGAAEVGLGGVTVNLRLNGTQVATTTTATDGYYLFDNLPPEAGYQIQVIRPTGYLFVLQDQGGDDALDSDVAPATGLAATTELLPGEDDLTWDAGLVRPARIGNFVWQDVNSNGLQDGGEAGVAGVTVRLLDGSGTVLRTTTTNASGGYSFTNLYPGTYAIEVVLPTSPTYTYRFSPQDQGDDALDSDVDPTAGPTLGRTSTTVLDPGEIDNSWDAGIVRLASIGDYVWRDDNNNGIQDTGESPVPDVTVNLLDAGGNVINSTTTNASGYYAFRNLDPGDYAIQVVLPDHMMFSPRDQGASDAADSDIDPNPASSTYGRTINTTLTAWEDDMTWDAGLVPLASLGNFVWLDTNGNGVQDAGEPGVENVTVSLFDGSGAPAVDALGTPIPPVVTPASGAYSFTDLPPGDYYVVFSNLPAGLVFTWPDLGGNDATDSDADRTTGRTATTTLTPGENDTSWDAGLATPFASLGNYVWQDTNGDGVQDGTEAGVPNVTVNLYRSSAPTTIVATQTTDSGGLYNFVELPPGDYFVEFANLPAGFVLTWPDRGGDDATDSDADRITRRTTSTSLAPGEDDPTWDAGIVQPAALGDFVWRDTNGNGLQDGAESGVDGVAVNLYRSGETTPVATQTTSGGAYNFTNLPPGDYVVEFVPPAGTIFTWLDRGSDDALDSDASRTTGRTTTITLASGDNDLRWDAGIIEPASLGNFVWQDTNGNGVQDTGETGVNGVTVRLLDSSGNPVLDAGGNPITTTTANLGPDPGFYNFTNLIPGDYIVEFSNLPAGTVFTWPDRGGNDATDSDVDRTTGRTPVTTLTPGENDLSWDAGIAQPAALGNFVWQDTNGNGVQDGSEAGVDGVTVYLYRSGETTPVATQNTTGGGLYNFTNLPPGDYFVEFIPPAGNVFTWPDRGGDDATDSDADRTTGRTPVTTLTSGETDLSWDAGIVPPVAALGNFVWQDTNGNGIQDGGEAGVDGVTVNLYRSGETTPAASQTTTGGGVYNFTNLPPGDYFVEFIPPAGNVFTWPDRGGDDALDSDADRATGRTLTTTLTSGETDLTWDAGIVPPVAALGNFVWLDSNGNGVQDTGETGVDGVTVYLYRSGETTPVATQNTTGGGLYNFTNLPPGDYFVEFIPPAGNVFTWPDRGGDDALDSDADRTTGRTIMTTLTSGETDLSWDAGIVPPVVSLGNFVWRDTNGNGIQDGSEAGVDGVTVNLYRSGETTPAASQPTTGGGLYNFTNLPPGDYFVEFIPPAGNVFTWPDLGGDDALDSDADRTTGRTITTTLTSGETDLSWDAGVMPPVASLGDFVWQDTNGNGVQDGSEAGVDGVTVYLYRSSDPATVAATQSTAGGGLYNFTNLPPGDYFVEFVLPAGFVFTWPDRGGDDALDSDADRTTGRTLTTTLDAGENDPTWDAGIVPPVVSLGNFVWEDVNGNGIQEGGEAGVDGVTVNLYRSGETTPVASQPTTGGLYNFTNLPPGDYQVQFELPGGYIFTRSDQGGDDTTDSDADRTTGYTVVIPLVSGADDQTWDAGIVRPASIGDLVWRDDNANGLQDAGEPGLADVTVRLFENQAGGPALVGSTTTDASGNYAFTNLLPGNYTVQVVLPPGYQFSPLDQGADDGTDSDVDTSGTMAATDLIANENDLTWDAGVVPLGSIGNRVWIDNGDGFQDASEPGLAGVTVYLLDGAGNIIATTTTDTNGYYLFSNLPPGSYAIQVVLPSGYVFSPQNRGGDPALDSDVDPTSGRSGVFFLLPNQNDMTWDAGVVVPSSPEGPALPGYTAPQQPGLASIGDRVWIDRNNNGVQDATELGLGGVIVHLLDANGDVIATTTTDSNGYYLFTNLTPGVYAVQVVLPAGYRFGPQDQGADDTLDSDVNRSTGRTAATTLDAGENDLTWDAGLVPLAATGPAIFGGYGGQQQPEEVPAIPAPWQSVSACPDLCADWHLYHTNQTGDWEVFRLGDLSDRPSISPNLSQGEGAVDMAPTRSPNARWIVFVSNRDGNWELYLASTDGDSSKTRRLTYNTIAIDTDPVWGPNNFVVFETTRDGNWELYLIDMTTGSEYRLTNDPASDINAFWSPDGTKIVFQSDRSGQWQLYELELATGDVALLSDGSAEDVDPQYSHTGDQLLFRSYRDGENSVIYLLDINTLRLTRVSDVMGDATNPAWSPDDSLIAYQSDLDGDLDIYVYEVRSDRTRLLTDNTIPDYAPTWLCNTSEVIFTSEIDQNPNVFEAQALPIDAPAIQVDTEADRLTLDPADDIYAENSPVEENASREGRLPGLEETLGEQTIFLEPDVSVTEVDPSIDTGEAWESVNGCETVCPVWWLYQSDRTGDWEVFRADGPGETGHLNLSVGKDATDSGPTRAPNGQWVAFSSDRDGNQEIYIAAADGSQRQRATYDPATDTDPAWSPDSQRVVFDSNRNGQWDLYILDVQTGIQTRLTDSAADDMNASWSSAGGKIVFQSNRAGTWGIYVIDLASRTTTRLTPPEQNAYAPVYATGGSLIAFRAEQENGRSGLYVMQQDGTDIQLISDPNGNAYNPAWYVDDTLLAYQSDLDGDMDIYIYDFTTGQTRQLTDNTVPDYAPTWQCDDTNVIFTSEATGSADIFRTPALPIDAVPVVVEASAEQLTTGASTDRYPMGAPTEENASREED